MITLSNGIREYEMPEQLCGQLIVYYGKSEKDWFEEVCPSVLWALLDIKLPSNNLYFLDEESLHYFLSENVGDDKLHPRAKLLRRERSGFIKRRVKIETDGCLVKELGKRKWGRMRGPLLDLTILSNSIVRITDKRLKALEGGKG